MMTLPIPYYVDIVKSCRLPVCRYRNYSDINHWLPITEAPRSAKAKAYSRPRPKTNKTLQNNSQITVSFNFTHLKSPGIIQPDVYATSVSVLYSCTIGLCLPCVFLVSSLCDWLVLNSLEYNPDILSHTCIALWDQVCISGIILLTDFIPLQKLNKLQQMKNNSKAT